MPLAIDYRPKTFDKVAGNRQTVKALQTILNRDRKDIQHAILITGPSGCGKTTLARIVAEQLGCVGRDYTEVDSGQFRGIDTIRDIRNQMLYKPLEGKVRVWLLDECFAAGTLIKTVNGEKPIESICEGDSIYSVQGTTTVEKIFRNRVHLSRVVKLRFSDTREIITTKQHLFLTDSGWKEAQYLTKKDLILSFNPNIMVNDSLLKEGQNDLSELQKRVYRPRQRTEVLFQKVLKSIQRSFQNQDSRTQSNMPLLPRGILGTTFESSQVLLSKLLSKSKIRTARIQGKIPWGRESQKEIFGQNSIFGTKSGTGQTDSNRFLTTDEEPKSYAHGRNYRKGQTDETNQWHLKYMERGTWGKWEIYGTSIVAGVFPWVENGIGHFFGKAASRISDLLQSRYWKFFFKNRDRGRWEYPSIEREYVTRCEKGEKAYRIRLENSEIYERGSNDEFFASTIGDKERNQGFVEFFDLQIAGHPSYFANGVPVHNCHQCSKDAQSAMLKALEDAPAHVFFILATTDPEKLLPTIKGRCAQFEVQPLDQDEMTDFLSTICRKERKRVPADVLKQISRDSMGSCRNALQVLDKVIDLDPEDMKAVAEQEASKENQVIDLCRALMKREKWPVVTQILKGLEKEDPEKVRLAVMGYASTVALNEKDASKAYLILDVFKDPTYNNGRSQLVWACYTCLEG